MPAGGILAVARVVHTSNFYNYIYIGGRYIEINQSNNKPHELVFWWDNPQ